MDEIWKDVVGYEGYYQVSSYGNVRSVDRIIKQSDGKSQFWPSHVLTKRLSMFGYEVVTLSKMSTHKNAVVHRLVAEAFIPNPNNLRDVNHIDFNRENNCVSNLEWLSHKDNIQHAIRAGRHASTYDVNGDNNPNYGNHKLREYYKEHPDETKKLGAKGEKNGRAKPIMCILGNGEIMRFGYIRECAKYFIDNKLCTSEKINSVSTAIVKAANSSTPYCDCQLRWC